MDGSVHGDVGGGLTRARALPPPSSTLPFFLPLPHRRQIYDSALLGEGCLPALRHALAELLVRAFVKMAFDLMVDRFDRSVEITYVALSLFPSPLLLKGGHPRHSSRKR